MKDQQKSQKGQHVMNFTEEQALAYFEATCWPNGPACVHCGSANVYRMEGETIPTGLMACRDCRGHFTVMVGTVMEDTHLPLATWAKAFHLMISSKKGISALQLQRNLGPESTRRLGIWPNRIRLAMIWDSTVPEQVVAAMFKPTKLTSARYASQRVSGPARRCPQARSRHEEKAGNGVDRDGR